MKFTVTGAGITHYVRLIVLERDWTNAKAVLMDSNVNKEKLIMKILSGDMKLSGENEKIFAEEDDDQDYKEEVRNTYKNIILTKYGYREAYAFINTLSEKSELAIQRANLYKLDEEDVLVFKYGKALLCRLTERTLPPWLEETIDDNLFEIGVTFENCFLNQRDFVKGLLESDWDIAISEHAVELEIQARRNLAEKIQIEFIREQVCRQETEWIKIKNYEIPKTPFSIWAKKFFSTVRYSNKDLFDLELNWIPCSPKGLKMMGDDPYHTDWVIGAGFNPAEFYNSEANKEIFDFLYSLTSKKLIPLNGKGQIIGEITFDVNNCSGKILVVPHAGVEFFEASKTALATICAIGGPAAHLVLNASEYNIHLALVQDALTFFKEKSYVSLSFDLGTISFDVPD